MLGSSKKLKQLEDENRAMKKDIANFQVVLEKRLLEFHNEVTGRYFDTLEKIFRSNKEISLINALAKQLDDKDFARLKAELMQPLLQARWAEEKRINGQQIVNQGEKVIDRRNKLHDEIIEREKSGEDVKMLKERIQELDWIIKGIKNET